MTELAKAMDPGDGEEGFALVAALVALLMFAFFAYAVLAADRGATAGVDASLERAELEAAADAALATAVERLGASGSERWPIDGPPHSLDFDGVQTEVRVEDERGKAPLNGLSEDQARRLIASTGASGATLNAVADSLMNWEDGADRADGAKQLDYAAEGLRERAGPIKTFGELAAVHGMSADMLARLSPITSLFVEAGSAFDPRTASPQALSVMTPGGADGPDVIIRARELSGERPKLDAEPEASYVGRPFTVRVAARDGRGGYLQRATVVVLTGQPKHPFWVRAVD